MGEAKILFLCMYATHVDRACSRCNFDEVPMFLGEENEGNSSIKMTCMVTSIIFDINYVNLVSIRCFFNVRPITSKN